MLCRSIMQILPESTSGVNHKTAPGCEVSQIGAVFSIFQINGGLFPHRLISTKLRADTKSSAESGSPVLLFNGQFVCV